MFREVYHIPALLKDSVDGLAVRPDGVYVDVTFGGGGHSREILNRLGSRGRLFAFDQDVDAFANYIEDERFVFIQSNFRYLKNFLRYHGVTQVDGILADLGVSFHHFDDETRGFSFRFESPLDMRMNCKSTLTAADILNNYDEDALTSIFKLYGELDGARRLAKIVITTRETQRFSTVNSFLNVLEPLMGRERAKKDFARAFQALRIEVNNEILALKMMLSQAVELLKPGGRLSVLSYHSLEDRLVKNFMKSGNFDGEIKKDFFGNSDAPMRMLTNKVILPSEEEIVANPRSRSAKLRIAQKL